MTNINWSLLIMLKQILMLFYSCTCKSSYDVPSHFHVIIWELRWFFLLTGGGGGVGCWVIDFREGGDTKERVSQKFRICETVHSLQCNLKEASKSPDCEWNLTLFLVRKELSYHLYSKLKCHLFMLLRTVPDLLIPELVFLLGKDDNVFSDSCSPL